MHRDRQEGQTGSVYHCSQDAIAEFRCASVYADEYFDSRGGYYPIGKWVTIRENVKLRTQSFPYGDSRVMTCKVGNQALTVNPAGAIIHATLDASSPNCYSYVWGSGEVGLTPFSGVVSVSAQIRNPTYHNSRRTSGSAQEDNNGVDSTTRSSCRSYSGMYGEATFSIGPTQYVVSQANAFAYNRFWNLVCTWFEK